MNGSMEHRPAPGRAGHLRPAHLAAHRSSPRSVMRRVLVGVACCCAAIQVQAQVLSPQEGLNWLQRIAGAARQLNYAGTFVYQHGDTVETSRIVHLVEPTGEIEKLETLDGPRREVLRTNDVVVTYHPDTKALRVDRRQPGRSFPQLLPDQLSTITDHYEMRRGELERVAGFEAQSLMLVPRDGLRYGHKFWADTATGLLLKAKVVDERAHAMELFAFTQLQIGGHISRDLLKSGMPMPPPLPAVQTLPDAQTDSGWIIRDQPAGFRKIMDVRRARAGVQGAMLTHIVLSDGLAAISIFIEPVSVRARGVPEGRLIQQGPIHIFMRVVGDQRVTVLGETPAHTVVQIANSLVPKGR